MKSINHKSDKKSKYASEIWNLPKVGHNHGVKQTEHTCRSVLSCYKHVREAGSTHWITVNLSPGNTNFCEKKPLADMMVEWLD